MLETTRSNLDSYLRELLTVDAVNGLLTNLKTGSNVKHNDEHRAKFISALGEDNKLMTISLLNVLETYTKYSATYLSSALKSMDDIEGMKHLVGDDECIDIVSEGLASSIANLVEIDLIIDPNLSGLDLHTRFDMVIARISNSVEMMNAVGLEKRTGVDYMPPLLADVEYVIRALNRSVGQELSERQVSDFRFRYFTGAPEPISSIYSMYYSDVDDDSGFGKNYLNSIVSRTQFMFPPERLQKALQIISQSSPDGARKHYPVLVSMIDARINLGDSMNIPSQVARNDLIDDTGVLRTFEESLFSGNPLDERYEKITNYLDDSPATGIISRLKSISEVGMPIGEIKAAQEALHKLKQEEKINRHLANSWYGEVLSRFEATFPEYEITRHIEFPSDPGRFTCKLSNVTRSATISLDDCGFYVRVQLDTDWESNQLDLDVSNHGQIEYATNLIRHYANSGLANITNEIDQIVEQTFIDNSNSLKDGIVKNIKFLVKSGILPKLKYSVAKAGTGYRLTVKDYPYGYNFYDLGNINNLSRAYQELRGRIEWLTNKIMDAYNKTYGKHYELGRDVLIDTHSDVPGKHDDSLPNLMIWPTEFVAIKVPYHRPLDSVNSQESKDLIEIDYRLRNENLSPKDYSRLRDLYIDKSGIAVRSIIHAIDKNLKSDYAFIGDDRGIYFVHNGFNVKLKVINILPHENGFYGQSIVSITDQVSGSEIHGDWLAIRTDHNFQTNLIDIQSVQNCFMKAMDFIENPELAFNKTKIHKCVQRPFENEAYSSGSFGGPWSSNLTLASFISEFNIINKGIYDRLNEQLVNSPDINRSMIISIASALEAERFTLHYHDDERTWLYHSKHLSFELNQSKEIIPPRFADSEEYLSNGFLLKYGKVDTFATHNLDKDELLIKILTGYGYINDYSVKTISKVIERLKEQLPKSFTVFEPKMDFNGMIPILHGGQVSVIKGMMDVLKLNKEAAEHINGYYLTFKEDLKTYKYEDSKLVSQEKTCLDKPVFKLDENDTFFYGSNVTLDEFEFQDILIDPDTENGSSIGFTTDYEDAIKYSFSESDQPIVFEVRLHLDNPYFIDDENSEFIGLTGTDLTDALSSKGYDGFIRTVNDNVKHVMVLSSQQVEVIREMEPILAQYSSDMVH